MWNRRSASAKLQRKTPQVCRYFNKPEGCRFGPKCKFEHSRFPQTHERDAGKAPVDHTSSKRNIPLNQRDVFVQWRYGIPLHLLNAQGLGSRLTTWWQTALSIVDTEPAITQEVILALVSEGGFFRLKELLDRDYKLISDSAGKEVLIEQLLPFFKILTHHHVASSLILEDAVGSIYNLLYGRQGHQGVKLFEFVTKMLNSSQITEALSADLLKPVLEVFSSMIDINSHALVNEELHPLAACLSKCYDAAEDASGLGISKLMARVQKRLGIGNTIENVEQHTKKTQEKAKFIMPSDPPGSLSQYGPRHNNDHADIGRIEILPTFQEIKSMRPPYLPPCDPSQLHLTGIKGLLDRQFRLLREDTVGQLRDAIGAELASVQLSKHNTTRTNTYQNLLTQGIHFSRWKGVQLLIQIDQLVNLHKMSAQERKDWWEYSNRLKLDALVCIVGQQDSILFCTVSEVSHSTESGKKGAKAEHSNKNMHSSARYCHLQLRPVNSDASTISKILKEIESQNNLTKSRLVEFPGVLLPSFEPTLEALKKMSTRDDLPFAEFLAPMESSTTRDVLSPPLYSSSPGFHFDLKSVMNNGDTMLYAAGKQFDMDRFKARSRLDDAQADALINCLNNSLALIQGPPGTGKSYTGVSLIKVLLDVKARAKLGPILCVCYTNHALDQLLEHLVRHGVSQIIRVGSRSKSELLENCNLRSVAQGVDLTAVEKRMRWTLIQELEAEEKEIKDLLQTFSDSHARNTIKNYLATHHVKHYNQLFATDDEQISDDGYQTVHHGRGDEIRKWLRGGNGEAFVHQRTRTIEVLQHVALTKMNQQERKRLYVHWLADLKRIVQEKLLIAIQAHQAKKTQFDRIRHGIDLRCLQEANIIGVTTTGLARQLDLLRNLPSRVMICEEAGEVLEAHILTALLPSLEHVILIGDHLQLPPHIQNYELSRESGRGEQYSLDRSLFERLVVPDNANHALPFSVLETQRRMHPSISQLIRSTLYPQLKDFPDVASYPKVAGMKRRLFWFDHNQPEAGSTQANVVTTSHSNDFEVDMVVALVTHLVRQGVYNANEVAVLTPYLGQLHKIRKVLRNQFEITMNERDIEDMQRHGLDDEDTAMSKPRKPVAKTALLKALAVSTIDNFQGEEAQVVVISLVRSNDQNKCGFLRTSNRINVLLSRAKHGMYIIGNSATSSHVKMWSEVISMLQENGNFGQQLELECPRHPDTPIMVSTPDEFTIFSPEGGCNRKCDKRLDCGHRDPSKCHSDILHEAVKCLEPCARSLKGCEHSCPLPCGERCIRTCQVELTGLDVKLVCGHTKSNLPCWQYQDPSTVRCQTIVNKAIRGCGHTLDLDCYVDVTVETFKCTAICGATLDCDHLCQRTCSLCNTRQGGIITMTNHGKCQQQCGKKFNSCSHHCNMECHGGSPCECAAACENFCEHSRCGKRCGEPCAPCASTTCGVTSCSHSVMSCSMPCAAPCDRIPCSQRCDKYLACGHQCPTVCGEKCPPPQFCQICASQDVQDTVVDYIMMSTYGETNLNEDPCIIPACGHILTMSSMDGQMDMSAHYILNENAITDVREASLPFSMDELKVCGTCRGSLRNITRYGRIVRRGLLDESTKKFIRWAGLQTITLTNALHAERERLSTLVKQTQNLSEQQKIRICGSTSAQLTTIRPIGGARYKRLLALRARIAEHLHKVDVDEQPFKRVWNLVQYAKRNHGQVGDLPLGTDVLQTRETVQVTSLLLRCDITILCDFFSIMEKAEITVDLSHNRKASEHLIELATEAKQPYHVVEGHIFYAQICAAEKAHVAADAIDDLIEDAKNHIAMAKAVCAQYSSSTRRATSELEEVEKMLRSSTFYVPMRDSEWEEVIEAMAREFRGSGHWYTCANGHPFTIGECGMPMQLARCPQCDAPIGGQEHQAAEGVRHAEDLEARFRQMRM